MSPGRTVKDSARTMMKHFWKIVKLSSLVLSLLLLQTADLSAQETLRVSGATTVQPVAERVAVLYRDRFGGTVLVQGGGSGAGIRNTADGTSDIGMVSRALTAVESEMLTAITYGFDALVFIVNEQNPIQGLSLQTVRQLYTGAVDEWSSLVSWDEGVVLVNKEVGRATLDLFEDYAGVSHADRLQAGSAGRVAPGAYEIASNLEAMTLVGGIPGAIGYVSMGAAESLIAAGMPIRVLPLDGVMPGTATLADGSYPILRELNLVVPQLTERLRNYTDMFFESEIQTFIQASGVIPAERQ
ncbi:MAG: hypothetical protein EA383_17000 [Spirochaetaceae bacterium]|nr:MAG: hypothetical protein EA383_17000 [Spirochaetaceae bacterium]